MHPLDVNILIAMKNIGRPATTTDIAKSLISAGVLPDNVQRADSRVRYRLGVLGTSGIVITTVTNPSRKYAPVEDRVFLLRNAHVHITDDDDEEIKGDVTGTSLFVWWGDRGEWVTIQNGGEERSEPAS